MATHPRETTDETCQAFWRAAEAAREVHDRYQFFVWLRLHLNHFVPHDMVLCLFREPGAATPVVKTELFYSVPVDTVLLNALTDGCSHWWRSLDQRRAGGSRQAAVIPLIAAASAEEAGALHAAGFRALLVHGCDSHAGMRPETAFVFMLREQEAGTARQRRLELHLELCLPVLHCTAVRALAPAKRDAGSVAETSEGAPRGAGTLALTRRQIQIIAAVRDAKRNSQIGEMLGISPATVKNHLHTIMQKLNATNRAQAVAEAMARRLIT